MPKHTKSWMAPSQRERKNKHGATEAAGVYGNSDHLDAKGLWADPLMAQGLAWKMHTEARDEKTSDWLQAIHKTAKKKGLTPTTPKHPSLADGHDVVGQKRQQTRSRLKQSANEGVQCDWDKGDTLHKVSGDEAAKARQVEALVLMMGGSKVGEGSQFWTDYDAGLKDAAQQSAKDAVTGGTVEMSTGGGWLDGSSSGGDGEAGGSGGNYVMSKKIGPEVRMPGIPWADLSDYVGKEGAKYAWDMNSIDFAEGATGEANFTAPQGDVDMTRTWGSIEKPILEARLGAEHIHENRLTPEQVAEFKAKQPPKPA